MAHEEADEGWARVEAPAWLWGGQPRQLFVNAQYRVRPTPGGGGFLVRPTETYERTKPDLVRFGRIAGAGVAREDWRFLDSMADGQALEDVRERVAPLLHRLDEDSAPDIVGMATYYQIRVGAVPSQLLAEQSSLAFESIREIPLESTGDSAFPNAGVYAIRRSDALLHRIKLISVLLRVQHDPLLRSGDVTEVQRLHNTKGNVFASSSGLHKGFYLLDQYVSPVLGALTPGVWGFAAHRGYGPVVFSFGRPVAGSSGRAPELLRTLATRGADETTHFDDLHPSAIPSALGWWTARLNELFGVLTDPSVFSDHRGIYQPALHLQSVLTVEQVFSRVLSIQANHHDASARRVLLFTVLDSLESLTGRQIEKNCDHDFGRRRLDHLREVLPPGAAEVLLPRATAAVDSLARIQDGFFLREPDGSVMLRPSTGQTTSPARAAAEYLKLLRNATHGHGAIRDSSVEPTESLLARHDGEIPHELALLGWLYLLDLMLRPDVLRLLLTARSRKYDPSARSV